MATLSRRCALAFLALAAAQEWQLPSELPECRGSPRSVSIRVGLSSQPVDMQVAAGTPEGGHDNEGTNSAQLCRAVWLSHHEVSQAGVLDAALDGFDAVFTESLASVPFAGRRGRLHFLERVGQIYVHADTDAILASKEHLVSVLLPADDSEAWEDPTTHEIKRQALLKVPQHTFVDNGDVATYAAAFAPYRFSLIVDDEAHRVSQAFVQCMGFQTVPVFNGFLALNSMLHRGVVPYNRTYFNIDVLRSTLPDVNHDIGWLWNYHRMAGDALIYRYGKPFEARLVSFACTVCRSSVLLPPAQPQLNTATSSASGQDPPVHVLATSRSVPLAFAGVYSAKSNFERRQTIRETWGRVLTEYGVSFKFFVGEVSHEPYIDDERARLESTIHGDVVALGVAEGYEKNSVKGLRFLEWCAQHVLAEFLVKVDDDVYVRPAPLIEILRRRPPAGFVWGYFDYMSPVPAEEGVPFYNPEEYYPYPVFPPYPRGLVRAISMDVVRRIAQESRAGRLRLIYGDDPCLGVHLRQIVLAQEEPIPMLTFDDRDSYRAFAMEPSCNTRLWSHVTPRSWVTHHVTPEQIRCMWEVDLAASYYVMRPDGSIALGEMAATGATIAAEIALAQVGAAPDMPPLPDACECLLTGPLAAELANRTDKINATSTYQMWGDPNFELEED